MAGRPSDWTSEQDDAIRAAGFKPDWKQTAAFLKKTPTQCSNRAAYLRYREKQNAKKLNGDAPDHPEPPTALEPAPTPIPPVPADPYRPGRLLGVWRRVLDQFHRSLETVEKSDTPMEPGEAAFLLKTLLSTSAQKAILTDARAAGEGTGPDFAWDDDPVRWAGMHGLMLWSRQRRILRACESSRFVSVRSCNASGKTTTAALAALHHSFKHRGEDAIAVAMSSGWANLREGVMRRIRQFLDDWDLPGELTERGLKIDGRTAVTFRSPPKSGAGTARKLLQGVHARHVLIIVDEANEIPADLWAEMISTSTGEDSTVLALGNPTAPGTMFEKTFSDPLWENIHIGWEHVLRARNEECLDEASAAAILNEETVQLYRTSHPPYEYKARIKGEFPTESELLFFDLVRAEAAVKRTLEPAPWSRAVYGLDPGSGGDASVLAVRRGSVIEMVELGVHRHSSDRKEVASVVSAIVRGTGASAVVIDNFGVGAEHAAHLAEMLADTPITVKGFNSGDAQERTDEAYVNPRAELGGRLRKRFESGDVSIPDDAKLKSQIRGIRAKPHPGGKVQLEPKIDFKARYGGSCDELDAVLLTMVEPAPMIYV